MIPADDFEHGRVDLAVGCQHARLFQAQGSAPAVGGFSSGFLDEEATGGEVPGGEQVFEEAGEPAQADPAEVERGAAHSPDSVDFGADQVAHCFQGGLHQGAPVVGEAAGQHRLVELVVVVHVDRQAVEVGPLAPDGPIPVVEQRVDHHPHLGHSVSVVGD